MSVKKIALLAISVYASSGISTATQIMNSSGLVSSMSTQTFDGSSLSINSQIGAQFGDVASASLFYDANPSCAFFEESGNCVSNFQDVNGAAANVQTTFSILFNIPQTYAAFAIIQGGAATDTFTALLNGNVVDSFTTPIVSFYNPNAAPPIGAGNYYGFANEIFDTIQVSMISGSNLAVIDNVQLSNTAPEPGTVVMIGLGLVGVGLGARRRRGAKRIHLSTLDK